MGSDSNGMVLLPFHFIALRSFRFPGDPLTARPLPARPRGRVSREETARHSELKTTQAQGPGTGPGAPAGPGRAPAGPHLASTARAAAGPMPAPLGSAPAWVDAMLACHAQGRPRPGDPWELAWVSRKWPHSQDLALTVVTPTGTWPGL